MSSLAQCQYLVAFLYFGTGFDTEHIYKRYNIQNYSINRIQLTELTTGYSGMAESYLPPILQP